MKKSFLVALMAVVCSLSACANDQLIPYAQLPEAAKATVQQYFDPGTVAYCTLDREIFGNEYQVRFNDGTELKFESDGSLHKVDCQYRAVPEGLIPEVVRQQILASFPQAVIVEWGKDDWGWKAELANKLEIKFNSNLQMIGVDD